MTLQQILIPNIKKAVQILFEIDLQTIEFQATRKEFDGDITMVIFPLLKIIKGNPAEIGSKIGTYLVKNVAEVEKFNVVAGFLNLVITDKYYLDFFNEIKDKSNFGFVPIDKNAQAVMVEYSSPNTNKPLHLGHVRNNLLGYSVAEILKASGKKVYKTQIINDRGIHICKSMLAWKLYGKGETPQSSGLKGDKLVGKYYVEFDKCYKTEISNLELEAERIYSEKVRELEIDDLILTIEKIAEISIESVFNSGSLFYNNMVENIEEDSKFLIPNNFIGNLNHWKTNNQIKYNEILKSKTALSDYKIDSYKIKKEIFEDLKKINILQLFAQQMLLDWEAAKPEVMELWRTMNSWVYEGFDVTYKNLGVDFDSKYYESNTYLLGKDVVANELAKGKDKSVFYQKPDNSVWIDLTADGLDEKIVQRSDGTSVYMTQDIGTAIQRVKDYPDVGGMVYTVGNEQDYHFKVLFLILKKLGFDWSKNLYHLSYGMVELPSGKMKSREGTVVDADDLMVEMTETAEKISTDLGKLEGYSAEEKAKLYKTIGLGALKYYILKIDPKKQIMFNPEESVDFAGNTGPFIQYTYARIQSILRKADFDFQTVIARNEAILTEGLHEKEKELIKQLAQFPDVIQSAASNYSPALVANYSYDLVKEYNSFYQSVSILGESNLDKKVFRVQLSNKVADTIKLAFSLLGIEVPERM